MDAATGYEAWVNPHLLELEKYCRYLTGSRWDAEDLLQDTLLKAFVFFVQIEQIDNRKAFVFRIARNLWIDECRRRRRRSLALAERPAAFREDDDYAEISGTVEWLAERMPRRNIESWLLFHYFGYSMQEVSMATGCSVPAVKSLLHRTRETLRGRGVRGRGESRVVIRLDVERWTRAILQERPQLLLGER